MENTYLNFGLLGQQAKEEYDNFLCLGKKCKQRKKERHQARMAKKNAKTDARKADTERVRAETQVIQQATNSTPSNPVITMPLTKQKITPPSIMASSEATKNETPKDGFPNNVLVVVIGVSILGGCLYLLSQKNQAAMSEKKGALAA